jgi:hypothetical protein
MAHGRAQKGKKEIYGRKKCKMEGRGRGRGRGGGGRGGDEDEKQAEYSRSEEEVKMGKDVREISKMRQPGEKVSRK